jgi:hypothetical protein
MTRSVMTAVQQLLDAQEQAVEQLGFPMVIVDTPDASIAQLHSKVIPAARILAPVDVDATSLPPEVTPHQRQLLAQASFATITWLAHGLDEGTITGKTVTEQACELLCVLSDVIFAAYMMVVPPSAAMGHASPSSSSSTTTTQRRRATDFTQLGLAGESTTLLHTVLCQQHCASKCKGVGTGHTEHSLGSTHIHVEHQAMPGMGAGNQDSSVGACRAGNTLVCVCLLLPCREHYRGAV